MVIVPTSRGRVVPEEGGTITMPHPEWEGDISVLFPIAMWFCYQIWSCSAVSWQQPIGFLQAHGLLMNIITLLRPTDTREASTTPERRHYLLEILPFLLQILHSPLQILHSLLQILHSGLDRRDVVDLQSMNILGNHIATGYN